MDRKDVVSSHIHSVGYDEANQALEVKFNSGKVFSYAGVPPEKAAALLSDETESVGRYFNAEIRGQYQGAEVKEGEPAAEGEDEKEADPA